MTRWLARLGLIVAVIVAIATGLLLYGYARFVRRGPLVAPTTVVVPRGHGVESVARTLETAGVIRDGGVFTAGVALLGGRRPLKAGEYAFAAGISAADAMRLMQEGRTV